MDGEFGLYANLFERHFSVVGEAPVIYLLCNLVSVGGKPSVGVAVAKLNEDESDIILFGSGSEAVACLIGFAGLSADTVFI